MHVKRQRLTKVGELYQRQFPGCDIVLQFTIGVYWIKGRRGLSIKSACESKFMSKYKGMSFTPWDRALDSWEKDRCGVGVQPFVWRCQTYILD